MKELNLAQVEQLKQIGAYLAEEREKQALPLDEIALKTFIPLRLLQALEHGQIDRLPEPVFVQGFIRRYADMLGLDGTAISKGFDINTAPTSVVAGYDSDASAETHREPPKLPPLKENPTWSNRATSTKPADKAGSGKPWLPLALAGAIALLVGGGAFAFFNQPKPVRQQTAVAPSNPAPAAAPAKPAVTEAPKPTAPIEVAVSLTDDSWIEVIADGQSKTADTLARGTKKTWTAQKSLRLVAGNASAVKLSFNGGEPKPFGAVADVKEASFTPNGMNVVE